MSWQKPSATNISFNDHPFSSIWLIYIVFHLMRTFLAYFCSWFTCTQKEAPSLPGLDVSLCRTEAVSSRHVENQYFREFSAVDPQICFQTVSGQTSIQRNPANSNYHWRAVMPSQFWFWGFTKWHQIFQTRGSFRGGVSSRVRSYNDAASRDSKMLIMSDVIVSVSCLDWFGPVWHYEV